MSLQRAVRMVMGLGLLAAWGCPDLPAQASRIEGRVLDEVTGAPVPNAIVRILKTSRESRSDSLGAYRLDSLPPGPFTLRVDAAGHTSYQQDFEPDSGAVVVIPIGVSPIAVLMEQLTVRAAARARPSAASRRVVWAGRSGDRTNDALVARVPGARVVFQNGAMGTATEVLLRGPKSLTLSGEPLYYLDGIPVLPPERGTRARPGQTSILDVLDPATIERIEVLSGAAASAAFGLGANNGVILIYTRR